MSEGVRHLIECHCFLPQYRNRPDPVFHKFVVFSEIYNEEVKEKNAQCNNCGVIHKVTGICKSEILTGREEAKAIISIEDIKLSLPSRITEILSSYSCDLSIWENVEFVFRESKWGTKIKISYDESEDEIQAKFLKINAPESYGIIVESGKSFIEN